MAETKRMFADPRRRNLAIFAGIALVCALLALLGMVNHTAQWYRPRGPLSPEQIADGYVDLVLGAD